MALASPVVNLHHRALLLAPLVLAAACSSEPTATPPSAPAGNVAAIATPTTAEVVTLEQVITELQKAGATDFTINTAETDPNKLLGRPDKYTARASFALPGGRPAAGDDVGRGGSVEIWPTEALAQQRLDFIKGTVAATPILGAEYQYLAGPVLVRVAGDVTPANAAKVEAVVKALPR